MASVWPFLTVFAHGTLILLCVRYSICMLHASLQMRWHYTHAKHMLHVHSIWRIYVEWAIASWHWTLSNYTTSYAFEITIYAIGCGSGVVWWQPSNGFQQSEADSSGFTCGLMCEFARTYLMPNTGAHGSTPRSTERVLIHIHDVERWWLKLQRFAIPFSTSA